MVKPSFLTIDLLATRWGVSKAQILQLVKCCDIESRLQRLGGAVDQEPYDKQPSKLVLNKISDDGQVYQPHFDDKEGHIWWHVGELVIPFDAVEKAEEGEKFETDRVQPDDSFWPVELDIACQAWRAVRNGAGEGEGTPLQRLKNWLQSNYPDLSKGAIERIAIVANWEKSQGKK